MHPKLLATFLCLVAMLVLFAGAGEPAKKTAGTVFSVREFDLKPGVKAEVFERFVRIDMAGACHAAPGLQIRVMKGDRGDRKGAYYLLWEFESVAVRNRYFPKEGSWSCGPAFDEAWKHIGPTMDKFGSYVKVKDGYTDYVELGE